MATEALLFVGAPAQELRPPDRETRQALAVLHDIAGRADADGDASGASVLREAAVVLARRQGAFVAPDAVRAQCFGPYGLVVLGAALPLTTLRPRARSMLRLLSAHAGQPVHRETILAALWPDAETRAADRSMLTTLSSVRALLAATPAAGALRRDGQSYLLDATAITSDISEADRLLRELRRVQPHNPAAAMVHAAAALELYRGELLSEDGPAEWVVDLREHWRQQMVSTAHSLAVLHYRAANFAGAIAAARQGLALDRLSDPLWRVLVAALRADEDPVAAERAAAEYDGLLGALAS